MKTIFIKIKHNKALGKIIKKHLPEILRSPLKKLPLIQLAEFYSKEYRQKMDGSLN
jgi:hypothetical protein